jgi:hypothetical protein
MCLAVVTCSASHPYSISALRLAIGLHNQAAHPANSAFHMLFPALFVYIDACHLQIHLCRPLADGTDAYAYAKKIGRFRLIKRTEGVSSTDIVGRMLMCTRVNPKLRQVSYAAAVLCSGWLSDCLQESAC